MKKVFSPREIAHYINLYQLLRSQGYSAHNMRRELREHGVRFDMRGNPLPYLHIVREEN